MRVKQFQHTVFLLIKLLQKEQESPKSYFWSFCKSRGGKHAAAFFILRIYVGYLGIIMSRLRRLHGVGGIMFYYNNIMPSAFDFCGNYIYIYIPQRRCMPIMLCGVNGFVYNHIPVETMHPDCIGTGASSLQGQMGNIFKAKKPSHAQRTAFC